jgi:hypothetical protein
MVRNEFKEDNGRVFGMKPTQGEKIVEQEIVTDFCTPEFIRKTFAKVVSAVACDLATILKFPENTDVPTAVLYDEFVEANRHKIIPRFLGTVYLEFIEEETRAFVKKYKNPVVDFSKLQRLITLAAKRTMKDIF